MDDQTNFVTNWRRTLITVGVIAQTKVDEAYKVKKGCLSRAHRGEFSSGWTCQGIGITTTCVVP
ncbi:hypothetical protein C5167_048090 [Papaver somniferum]|uniref:Uncharacterized protein n=1 Tax=Papaver somniferum TaxID=3469 RepID=A0A4Y7KKX8_PAPSO|nr:hypothetical protein C5167_048090 [Papaver somniferum]